MAKTIQFSKCIFSIRCSYVLLDPAGLKSCLGEKIHGVQFYGDESELSLLELHLLSSFTKVKHTVTVAYLPLNQA